LTDGSDAIDLGNSKESECAKVNQDADGCSDGDFENSTETIIIADWLESEP
jgi:hypothetical protein